MRCGDFNIHSIVLNTGVDTVLPTNMGLYARSYQYCLCAVVHFNYDFGSASVIRLFHRVTDILRFDYRISILVYSAAEFTKVRILSTMLAADAAVALYVSMYSSANENPNVY